jgi:hypothetical protein
VIIISDDGRDMVNFDSAFAVSTQNAGDKGWAAVAFTAGLNTVLTVGSEERVRQCLDAVIQAIKQNWKILDLRDKLGQRPNLAVPVKQIVLPGNGGPQA